MPAPALSVSGFKSGRQCDLKLWYETHDHDIELPSEGSDGPRFKVDPLVGQLARDRYPEGRLIKHDLTLSKEALKETKDYLSANNTPTLYEAAFKHLGLIVRVDILERLTQRSWRLIEVKSATRLDDARIEDAALKLWVLRGAGIKIKEVGILLLNTAYVYQGGEYDLDELFKLELVTARANELQRTISSQVRHSKAVIKSTSAPKIEPGDHCSKPHPCPFKSHCTRDSVFPDHGIDELPGVRWQLKERLKELKVIEIRDIPEGVLKSDTQKIARKAVIGNRPIVHGNIQGALSDVSKPVRYLDFETFSFAIPRYIGTNPFQSIPFLFSVHVESSNGSTRHKDYIHKSLEVDPHPELANKLIHALGKRGTIYMYSSYEQRIIKNLIEVVPERARELNAILNRLVDLLSIVRQNYYHPEFRGSFSIKNVLPVVVSDSGYGDLVIADGLTAANQYVEACESNDPDLQKSIFQELRDYCERDTLAMVQLRHELMKLEREEES